MDELLKMDLKAIITAILSGLILYAITIFFKKIKKRIYINDTILIYRSFVDRSKIRRHNKSYFKEKYYDKGLSFEETNEKHRMYYFFKSENKKKLINVIKLERNKKNIKPHEFFNYYPKHYDVYITSFNLVHKQYNNQRTPDHIKYLLEKNEDDKFLYSRVKKNSILKQIIFIFNKNISFYNQSCVEFLWLKGVGFKEIQKIHILIILGIRIRGYKQPKSFISIDKEIAKYNDLV